MKKFSFLAIVATLCVSCSQNSAQQSSYMITAQFSDDLNNHKAYIVDYDTDAKIDSTIVLNGQAIFNSILEKPIMARLIIDGRRAGSFVLEADTLFINNGTTTGGALNSILRNIDTQIDSVQALFRAMPDSVPFNESEYNSKIQDVYKRTLDANRNNPVGYYSFLQQIYSADLNGLEKLLNAYPEYSDYTRVQRVQAAKSAEIETAEGKMFKDFEVVYNDTTYIFSDYIAKGKYTLVDFWASWCGPCIRQTAVIKDLYNEYHNRGLDVLGVAVWDEPDNTIAAVKSHNLPWSEIINAQRVPTDIYGISSIPCIIIFGPDGTIFSRGKQDEALRDVVSKLFNYSEIAE